MGARQQCDEKEQTSRHSREEGFAENGAQYEHFEARGQVCVDAVFAEELRATVSDWRALKNAETGSPSSTDLVVLDMVFLEHHREWHANVDVGSDRKQPVGANAPEGQVVRDLVYGEESILVGSRANDVRCRPEFERKEGCVAQGIGHEELEQSHAQDDVFCQGFIAHQFANLSGERNTGQLWPAADAWRRLDFALPLDELSKWPCGVSDEVPLSSSTGNPCRLEVVKPALAPILRLLAESLSRSCPSSNCPRRLTSAAC